MQSVFGDADAPIVVELAQNQIYKAFWEVGRVMRTVALLRFLAHSGLRARVTAATNKAEGAMLKTCGSLGKGRTFPMIV
jgi:TnpA family transposase